MKALLRCLYIVAIIVTIIGPSPALADGHGGGGSIVIVPIDNNAKASAGAYLNGNVSGEVTGNISNTNNVDTSNTNINHLGVTSTNTNVLKGGDQHQTLVNVNNPSQTTNLNVTTGPTTAMARGGDQEQGQVQGQHQAQGQKQGQEQTSISSVKGSGNSTAKGGDQEQGQTQKVQDAGNSTVQNVGNVNITYPKHRPAPPAPNGLGVTATAPSLFNQYGRPANVAGDDFILRANRLCPSVYTKGTQMEEEFLSSFWDKTDIVFSPFANYSRIGDGGPVERTEIVEISLDIKPGKKYLCLGIVQVEAKARKASEVSRATILADTLRSSEKMRGFQNIKLVYLPSALSMNIGNDSSARGFGGSPGVSGIAGTTLWTFLFGGSINSGQTYQAAQLGATFLVVADGDYPDSAPHIDLAKLVEPELDAIATAQSAAEEAEKQAAQEKVRADQLAAEKSAREKVEAEQRALAQERERQERLAELEQARISAEKAQREAQEALAILAIAQRAQEGKAVVAPSTKSKPRKHPPLVDK